MIEYDTHVVLFTDKADVLTKFLDAGFKCKEVLASTQPVKPSNLLTLDAKDRDQVAANHTRAVELAQSIGCVALVESEADLVDEDYQVEPRATPFKPFSVKNLKRTLEDRHSSDIHVDIRRGESTAEVLQYLENAGLNSLTLQKSDGPHAIITAQIDSRELGDQLSELIKGALCHFGGVDKVSIKMEQLLHYDFVGDVPGGPLPKTVAINLDGGPIA